MKRGQLACLTASTRMYMHTLLTHAYTQNTHTNTHDLYVVQELWQLFDLHLFLLASEDGTDQQYEIVFDESFLGGHTWRCSAGRAYCLNASSFVNISYGRRLDAKKKGGRHLHSNQWLPQATFHNFQPAEQVDYGFSHKTPDRANKSSSEKPPRQNRKQLYKSPDKAEVRLLRRPSDKCKNGTLFMWCHCFYIIHSIATTPTNNSRNNSVTSAVTTGTPSSGQTSVSSKAYF